MSPIDTTVAFDRQLEFDAYNTMTKVDNSTVIFRPRYNTTGFVELKVHF